MKFYILQTEDSKGLAMLPNGLFEINKLVSNQLDSSVWIPQGTCLPVQSNKSQLEKSSSFDFQFHIY